MNITITIEAPELVGAIESLAAALGGANPLSFVNPETVKKADKPKPAEEPKKETAPVKEVAPIKEEAPEAEPEKKESTEQAISLEYVRSKLTEHSSQGKKHQVEVKEAISHFGVKKLTEIDPKDYAKLLQLVEGAE